MFDPAAARGTHPLDDAHRRLQAVLDNASVAIFLMDDRQQCVFMNRAAEALTGYSFAEVLALDRPLHDIIHHSYPDGRPFPLHECAIDRAFPEHNQMQGEEVFVHKDGSFYPVAFTASPIRDDASQTIGTIIEVRGIAAEKEAERERRRAEAALRESEQLLRTIGDSSPNLIFAKDSESRMLYANRATLAVIGKPAEAVLGRPDIDWHDDPAQARATMDNDRQVIETGRVLCVEEQFTSSETGEARVYESTKAPLRDEAGRVTGVVGVVVDITERRAAEERQRLLLNELNHRVKNTLATVQSLAWQTFKSVDAEAFALFERRLTTLSRAHDILTQSAWSQASLREVVEVAMAPFDTSRITISGEDCMIEPKAAVSLTMVFHELATNAVKYGALGPRGGQVSIDWTCAENGGPTAALRIRWTERGGPPVSRPARTGFGSRLIQRQLAMEFGGAVEMDFAEQGLICVMDLNVAPSAEPLVLRTGREADAQA